METIFEITVDTILGTPYDLLLILYDIVPIKAILNKNYENYFQKLSNKLQNY
jgi:hypothetical protein